MPKNENLVQLSSEKVPSGLMTDIQLAVCDLPEEYIERIRSGNLYGRCGSINPHICRSLQNKEWKATEVTSDHPDHNGHIYDLVQTDIDEILVDGTLGQFIMGYQGVFVGTREELKKLVLSPETIITNTRSKNNKLEAFQRIWGEKSIPDSELI